MSCLGCKDRHVGRHSECESYLEYSRQLKETKDMISRAKRENKEYLSYKKEKNKKGAMR